MNRCGLDKRYLSEYVCGCDGEVNVVEWDCMRLESVWGSGGYY